MTSATNLSVDDVLVPLRLGGMTTYAGEVVSVTEHALQAASLAERDGSPAPLVAAALLHDIGWLLLATGSQHHEMRGHAFLVRHLGPEVTEPVRLHVTAKRYVCTVDRTYRSTLSAGSLRSLQRQGGLLDEREQARFEADPYATDALRLRRYDDLAKVPGASTPDLDSFAPLLASLLNG